MGKVRLFDDAVKEKKLSHSSLIIKRFDIALRFAILFSLVFSAVFFSAPKIVHAEAIDVPCNISSLRQAIAQANENGEPDTINLEQGCTLTLYDGSYSNGQGNNGMPIITSEIIVNGNGGTIERATNGGAPEFRLFQVISGGNLTLNNLTLMGGSLTDPHRPTACGCIYNSGSLTLNHITLTNNRAGEAAGICNRVGATATISASSITNNVNTFVTDGGGIQNEGTLTLTDTLIASNAANRGGGIYNKSSLTVLRSTFASNLSNLDGGGLYNDDGDVLLANSTFYGNTASGNGGAVFSVTQTTRYLTIINATVYKNGADEGGGLFLPGGNPAVISNSIIATSIMGGNCSGSFTDEGNNLRWPTTDASCVGNYGDPKLNPLGRNGGLTPTIALRLESAALDSADDTICSADPINSVDQRGISRPLGDHCDIGAYEGTNGYNLFMPMLQK
jgi:hypothetical protein